MCYAATAVCACICCAVMAYCTSLTAQCRQHGTAQQMQAQRSTSQHRSAAQPTHCHEMKSVRARTSQVSEFLLRVLRIWGPRADPNPSSIYNSAPPVTDGNHILGRANLDPHRACILACNQGNIGSTRCKNGSWFGLSFLLMLATNLASATSYHTRKDKPGNSAFKRWIANLP